MKRILSLTLSLLLLLALAPGALAYDREAAESAAAVCAMLHKLA